MKVVCDGCRAEYHISDEKVGRNEAVARCTRCHNLIVVRPPGMAPAGADLGGTTAASKDSGAPTLDEAEVTPLLAGERTSAEASRERRARPEPSSGHSAAEPEWFIAIDDRPIGPVAVEEIAARFKKGEVAANTLCWKAGMDGWIPASEVPRLAARLGLGSEPAVGPAGAVATGLQAPSSPPATSTEKEAEGGPPPSTLDLLVRAELDALDVQASEPVRAPAPKAREAPSSNRLGGLLPAFAEPEEAPPALPASEPPRRAPPPPLRASPSAPLALYVVIGLLAFLAAGAMIVATVVLVRSPTASAPAPEVAASAPAAAPASAAPEETPTEPEPPAAASRPAAALPKAPTEEAAIAAERAARPSPSEVAPAPQARGPVASRETPKPAAPGRAAKAPGRSARAPEPRRTKKAPSSKDAASKASRATASPAPSKESQAPRGEGQAASGEGQAASGEGQAASGEGQTASGGGQTASGEGRAPGAESQAAGGEGQAASAEGQVPSAGSQTPSAEAPVSRERAVDRAFDELFGEEPAGPPEAPPAPQEKPRAAIPPAPGWGTKKALTQSDVLGVVTANTARIRACTDAVRVPDQAQTVVLRWNIRPDGGVSAPAVVTPEFRDTPLAKCLTEVVGSLRFPSYSGPQMEPVVLPVRF